MTASASSDAHYFLAASWADPRTGCLPHQRNRESSFPGTLATEKTIADNFVAVLQNPACVRVHYLNSANRISDFFCRTELTKSKILVLSLSSAVRKSQSTGPFIENLLPKTLPKTDFAPFSGTKNREGEVPLTDSFERCYVPEVALLAGVAKLAYAADSKSAGVHSPWGFKSLLRH